MRKKTIHDIKDLARKSVFVTVDFNISLEDGKVANDTRIVESLPTIKFLTSNGAKVILASHLGRPKAYDKSLTLYPVARQLGKLTKQRVRLIDRFWEKTALSEIQSSKSEDGLILLENIRFHDGEKENDREFARHLASMADYFVNDAFGSSHRVHASIVGIAEFLPSYAGLLMDKEIRMISNALEHPKRPFVVIIGGAKTPEKIAVIEKVLDIADTVALGGAIANTFLAAWGFGMGRSMVDYEMVEMARVVFWKTTRKHSALILPLDVVTSSTDKKGKAVTFAYNKVPHDVVIYDIGPKTINHYRELIHNAQTVIWNGPMGFYEDSRYKKGTDSILSFLAKSRATTIIGGGDTLTSIKTKTLLNTISHVSTGGSAMLEFLEKGTLPGIDVLQDA